MWLPSTTPILVSSLFGCPQLPLTFKTKARSLMEEDRQHQPRSHNPLSDSVLARQLQDELNAGN